MYDYHSQAFHSPVCVADLPGYDFAVTPDTLTEKVVAVLEKQPLLPGVMLIEDGNLLGIISRLKLFERLSHCFGAETLLQKPISQFKGSARAQLQAIPGCLPVDEVIRFAFSRPPLDIYDPLAVLNRSGLAQMLDVNLLLLVQARMIASLSNVAGNLEQIDRLIETGWGRPKVFDEIILLLRQVVPYHQAAILIGDGVGLKVTAQVGYSQPIERADKILASPIYRIIVNHGHTIHVQNTWSVPAWSSMEILGMPSAWLGLPILDENRLLGLLSISRDVDRAFSIKEREIAMTFAPKIMALW